MVPSFAVRMFCSVSFAKATADMHAAGLVLVSDEGLLQALQEGLKHIAKSQKPGRQTLQESLTRRIAATTAFLQAQQLFSSDEASAVQACNGLIVEVCSSSRSWLQNAVPY